MQALYLKSMTQAPVGSRPPQGTLHSEPPQPLPPVLFSTFLSCLDEDIEAVLLNFEKDKGIES